MCNDWLANHPSFAIVLRLGYIFLHVQQCDIASENINQKLTQVNVQSEMRASQTTCLPASRTVNFDTNVVDYFSVGSSAIAKRLTQGYFLVALLMVQYPLLL